MNMAFLQIVCLLAVISAATATYQWAPSKGCMKLYKHLHTIGAPQIRKSRGQWTSAECRDYCAARPGCVAVDFTSNGNSCWEHTKKGPRVAIRPSTTSETSQYDKQGSCSGYSTPTGPFFGYQWHLLLGSSATSTTGLNGLSLYWSNTAIVPGPNGLSAWQFQGKSTSYVKITNTGKLNFGGSSWTIGTFFYQTGSIKNGPILEWRGHGRDGVHTSFGTHFWIWGGTLFTNIDASSGRSETWHWKAPTANAWHFIGASYDVNTGAFMMWIDNEVYQKNTGKLSALDQTGDVYIGVRPAYPKFSPLKAKLAGMTLMKGAITKSDIASFKAQIISTAAGGARAPQKKTLLLDMFLVLDASSSTGSSAFNSAKQYVITLLNTYTLGTNSLRIKLLYFNGASSTIITLDNDASVAGYITMIGNLRYGGATINLSFIVQRLSIHVFSTSGSGKFYRPNVARSAFLIGGLSSGSDVQTQTEISLYIQTLSTQLRFYYFAIGVTKDTSFWSQNLGSQYIVTSLRTETSYVVNWFVTQQTTLKVTGLGFTKKTQNLQLVLTLDGSSATGRVAYYKTFNLILTLLRTQTIGGNGLKLYIIVYNGGQPNVIRFTNANEVTTNLRTMMGASRTTFRYSGVTSNTITLLTKVRFVIQNYIQQNQPRTVWLLGGTKVTDQRQTLDLLKTIMVQFKVPLKYYGIGTQVDMKFWQSVLPTQSISTNVNVDVSNVVKLTADTEKEAVKVVNTGPVVKDVVKKSGETTTTPSTTTTTTTTTPTTTTTTTPTTTTTTPTTTTTTTTPTTTTTTTTPTTTTTTTTPTTTTTTTKKPKRVLKRDVFVTLDSTTASGRVAFNKAKEYILTLLRTYKIGQSSMRIYVVLSRATVSIQSLDDESKVDSYVTFINQQTYRGDKQDFVVVLEKIERLGDMLKTVESGRPRSLILIGGFPVPSDEDKQTEVEVYLRDLVERIRVNIQYFAIGVETQGKRLYTQLMGKAGTIHGTIDTSENSVVNIFSSGQNDAGPQKPKQNTNMQIVLTLDGSTATGKVAFYKTLKTIFSLLDTNNLGPNALQLFVIYYNGGAPGVIKFKTSADIAVFFKLLITTKISTYSGARPNTKAILELVKETVRTEVSPNKPKTVWLMGGMQVTDQEETKKILLTLQSEFKIFVYYFAIGVQQDTAFWTTVLDSQYVKTGGDASGLVTDASFITNFIIKIYRVVQNVRQGPTITTIVQNVGAKVDMGVTEESPLNMKMVNNKYWVPRALNVNSPNVCPGGTTPKEGTWCEISDLDVFITWAKTIGLTVTRKKVGLKEYISISGIIRRTQTVKQSGTLSIQQGALLPKWMVRNVCPSGTQDQGNSCKITNVNQFMTWLAKYGKEYGITQG